MPASKALSTLLSFRLNLSLVVLIVLIGCSNAAHNPELAPSQIDQDIRSAHRAKLDTPAERKSEAMQRFLMAELALDAERNDDALDDLRASSRLVATPDVQIQINLAKLYVSKGDLKSALSEINFVEEKDEEVLALRAALLQSLERWEEAVEKYNELLALSSSNIEARLMLALDALKLKQPSQAQALIEPVIKNEERNLPALKLMALAQRELGDSATALKTLEQIRQLDPGDLQAFETMLSLTLEGNREDILERELAREAKLNPESPVLAGFERFNWKNASVQERQQLLETLHVNTTQVFKPNELRYQIARFALLRQNFAEAIGHFSLLVAEKPKDDELRYTLALALSSSGRSIDATSTLEMIGKKSPWYIRAQAFAGVLFRQRGDYRRAEQAFRKALESDPKSAQLLNYLAGVLREAKKFDQAKKVYEDILAEAPGNEQILFSYAVLYHEMGDEEKSIEIMQRLIGVNPQHAEALNFIAFSLAEDARDLERALLLANRALQVQPENGFYLDTRGWIYFKMNRVKDAVKDLERAVDLSKGDPEISEHLADVYLKTARKKEALQVYKNALDNIVESIDEADKIAGERIRKKIEELKKSDNHSVN